MNERALQEGSRTNLGRRRFSTGLCLGLITAFAGCGGTFDDTTWNVVPTHALALTPGSSFDLAATLPPTVAPGGVFDVDPSGAELPAGFSLDPAGLLSVSSSATGGTAGVVFRYTPPA